MNTFAKTSREEKLFNLVKEAFPYYSSKISTISSRNQSNKKSLKRRRIINQRSTKKKILRIVNSKPPYQTIIKKIKRTILKYNSSPIEYNIKVINDIIYDERKHIVSAFKDHLLWNETNDFLKRFYYKYESIGRLPKIAGYYEQYTLYSPVYFHMDDIVKIMLKNIKRKKKYLEMIEEREENNNISNIKKEKKIFKYIINPNDINTTPHVINYETKIFLPNKLSTQDQFSSIEDFDFLLNCNIKENEPPSFYNKENSQNSKTFKNNLNQSISLFDISKDNKEKVKTASIQGKEKAKRKKGKIIEIKKLDLRNINIISNNLSKNLPNDMQLVLNTTNGTNETKTISERLQLVKFPLKNFKSKKLGFHSSKKNKNRKANLIIRQMGINKNSQIKQQQINFNTYNNFFHLMQNPKQFPSLSSRTSSVSQTKFNQSRKGRSNLVIKTNHSSSKQTKNNSTIRERSKSSLKKKKINKIPIKTFNSPSNPINNISNNNKIIIPSSVYNINLNVNLGNSTIHKQHTNNNYNNHYTFSNSKKSTNNIKSSSNSSSKSLRCSKLNTNDLIHTIYPVAFNNVKQKFYYNKKSNNITSKYKPISSNWKIKERFSYALNVNNVQITINKQSGHNNSLNVNTEGNSINQNISPSVNININCNNNSNADIGDKNISRNDVKKGSKEERTKFQSFKGKKVKRLVLPNKKEKDKVNVGKKVKKKEYTHENSFNLGKIKKKLQMNFNNKRIPLSSRNEKDNITYELIKRILKNK